MSPNRFKFPDGARIDNDGVWVQVLSRPRSSTCRPALFLDRDGVVVEEVGHLSRVEDVRLMPGAAEVIRAANHKANPVVLVSNQSGIGQELFDWPDFIAVQARILADLASDGAFLDGVLACPHHPRGKPPYEHPDHPARKPNPGMLMRAAQLLPVDLAQSWIIGDRARDIAAGRNAGLAGGLLVSTESGHQRAETEAALAFSEHNGFQVFVEPTITAAQTLLPLFARTRAR